MLSFIQMVLYFQDITSYITSSAYLWLHLNLECLLYCFGSTFLRILFYSKCYVALIQYTFRNFSFERKCDMYVTTQKKLKVSEGLCSILGIFTHFLYSLQLLFHTVIIVVGHNSWAFLMEKGNFRHQMSLVVIKYLHVI